MEMKIKGMILESVELQCFTCDGRCGVTSDGRADVVDERGGFIV